MIHRLRPVLWILVLFGLVPAFSSLAASLVIKTEKDPYAVFYPAKAYAWHPLSDVHPKFDGDIRAALDRELTAHGFQKSTAGKPDFWVGYQFKREEMTKKTPQTFHGGDYSWTEKQYRLGTLIIDVFSPDQRRIIWKGWSESNYDPKLSDEKKIQMANDAIKQIVVQMPPPG
ncbi:MAG TPA: DUF4136 domain-containing protein [Bdellovibrionota bacterium]|nr:DUF4136 domain-containing protein [Bdellovibrionota bacterium]